MARSKYRTSEEKKQALRESTRRYLLRKKGIYCEQYGNASYSREIRVWKRFKVNEASGCWEWYGAINKQGYGTLGSVHAHRVMWMLCRGEIPSGIQVMHKCDNRRCINVYHLMLGTPKDNADDMMAKGRWRGNVKLSLHDAIKMRDARRSGKLLREIASEFGITESHASRVCAGEIWQMSAIEEVNHWRRANGLPEFIEDAVLTQFCQHKAEYRALNGLRNGHDGPKPPGGCVEGTGEASHEWGWLTCAMEDSGTHAGAGMCIGWDDERYMVLVVRPPGRRLLSHVTPIDTSHLSPNPPSVRQLGYHQAPDVMTNLVEARRQ